MVRPLLLIAASGLAREVLQAVTRSGRHHVIGILDDNPSLTGSRVGGVPVLGTLADVADHPLADIVVCAGSGVSRANIVQRLSDQGVSSGRFATITDPSVFIFPGSTTVGAGSILLGNVVLTADVSIGDHVVVMPNVTLTHDVEVQDFCTLCAGVSVGGTARIARGAYVGMNASIREGLAVGEFAVLGMGAVLLQNLPARSTWAGVPARPLDAPSRSGAGPGTGPWIAPVFDASNGQKPPAPPSSVAGPEMSSASAAVGSR